MGSTHEINWENFIKLLYGEFAYNEINTLKDDFENRGTTWGTNIIMETCTAQTITFFGVVSAPLGTNDLHELSLYCSNVHGGVSYEPRDPIIEINLDDETYAVPCDDYDFHWVIEFYPV